MTSLDTARPSPQLGTTLIEVLVTMVILAFGMLGIAAFQAKSQVGSLESYQRAQAIMLLEDMQGRLRGNGTAAASYVTGDVLGTDDEQPGDCDALATLALRDLCEWSNGLKGAAEVKSSVKIGAMTGARGCITQIQAPDSTTGVCRPGIYLIAIAWQGLHQTIASEHLCGKDLYGIDTNRRVIAQRVAIGLPSCS